MTEWDAIVALVIVYGAVLVALPMVQVRVAPRGSRNALHRSPVPARVSAHRRHKLTLRISALRPLCG